MQANATFWAFLTCIFLFLYYRQQLEVMAEQFKFPSVHEFATEILRGNSSHRLSWLRQYYTSLKHSDVADIITENIPEPDSAQAASSATAILSSSTKRAPRNQQKKSLRAPNSLKRSQRNLKPRNKPESPQNNDPLPQIRSGNLENDDLKPPKKLHIIQKNVQDPLCEVPNPESEEQEEMLCSARGHRRTKKSSVSSCRAHRTDGALSVDQASSSGLGSKEAAAAFLNCTDRDTPSSSDPSRCSSATSSKPTGQETEKQKSPRWTSEIQRQRENSQSSSTSCNQSLLIDLIGDTSILDDILKPKAKNSPQKSTPTPPTPSVSLSTGLVKSPLSNLTLDTDTCSHVQTQHRVSTPVQATRSSRKDIWDILSEGNEESINRLTDPEELHRVCINTSFAERSLSKKRESKSLWKTNDNFLWKK